MDDIDVGQIKRKSIHGILALTSRTFFIQIITFISNLILTIILAPSDFGVFFVVTAAIAFLTYFSDIGLAAALIQKKDAITHDDLKTTFSIQQALVLSLVVIALASSNFIGDFYNLKSDGILLFQALAISFFLSSLKTIPSIILERNLDFKKLVIPQIVETLFFNISAVFFALNGFGVTSFSYAVMLRGISGLITIYIISPWKISIGISKKSAKKLLSFGVPFQLNSLLALIKDDLLIVYLGKVLPIAQVGYIGFAQKWAFMPLRLIMDNIIRITFPSFSRLQGEKEMLVKAIEKSIFAPCFLIFPALTGLVILSPYFIEIIPRYTKWEPALLSLFFFSINAVFSSVSTPLTNALNAVGKIKITLYLMVFWTATTWVLTPILIFLLGFNGVAIASALISSSVVIVVMLVKKYLNFSVFNAIFYPFVCSTIMGVSIYVLAIFFAKNFIGVILSILAGAMIYFLSSLILARRQLRSDLLLIRQSLKN